MKLITVILCVFSILSGFSKAEKLNWKGVLYIVEMGDIARNVEVCLGYVDYQPNWITKFKPLSNTSISDSSGKFDLQIKPVNKELIVQLKFPGNFICYQFFERVSDFSKQKINFGDTLKIRLKDVSHSGHIRRNLIENTTISFFSPLYLEISNRNQNSILVGFKYKNQLDDIAEFLHAFPTAILLFDEKRQLPSFHWHATIERVKEELESRGVNSNQIESIEMPFNSDRKTNFSSLEPWKRDVTLQINLKFQAMKIYQWTGEKK